MRTACLFLVLVACRGNDPATPPTPLAVAALTGTYTVNLTRVISSPVNPNFSCQQLQVTVTPAPAWAVLVCSRTAIQAGAVEMKADSVILTLATTQDGALSDFRFGGFTGVPENARAEWVGGSCVRAGGGCVRETGTAVWRR